MTVIDSGESMRVGARGSRCNSVIVHGLEIRMDRNGSEFPVSVRCSVGLCRGAGRRLLALLLGFLPTPICGPTPKACSNLFDVVVEPTSDLFSCLFDFLHDLVLHLSLLHSFLWGMHDRCLHFFCTTGLRYDRSPRSVFASLHWFVTCSGGLRTPTQPDSSCAEPPRIR